MSLLHSTPVIPTKSFIPIVPIELWKDICNRLKTVQKIRLSLTNKLFYNTFHEKDLWLLQVFFVTFYCTAATVNVL